MIYNRLSLFLTSEEVGRLKITENQGQITRIIVDVHGLKCGQAKRFINNIINSLRISFMLIVIHGYNNGTAIKDMLLNNFQNPHVSDLRLDPYNQGITRMVVGA